MRFGGQARHFWLLPTLIAALFVLAQVPRDPSVRPISEYQAILSGNAPRGSEWSFYRRLLATYRQAAERLLGGAAQSLDRGRRIEAEEKLRAASRVVLQISSEGDSPIIALREAAAESGRTYPRDPKTKEVYVLLPADRRSKLRKLAGEITDIAAAIRQNSALIPVARFLHDLSEILAELRDPSLSSPRFLSSYSMDPTLQQPAAGGHASAGHVDPPRPTAAANLEQFPQALLQGLNFEVQPFIQEKTFCGSVSKDHILESGGSGVALFDYDNDGLLDIFLVNAYELDSRKKRIPHANLLYRNLGNWKFKNVSHSSGVDLSAWGNGVCVGDYNNDGYLDLYVTNFGPNFLFRNNGDRTFTEVAAAAGVDNSGWSTGCSFFDADGDGNLDLYVARYVKCDWQDVSFAKRTLLWRGGPKVMVGPTGLPGARDVFYRNEGNGIFRERTEQVGLVDREGYYGFGVLATDYDGDGWVDLYVANDSNPSLLFRNQGWGRFKEIGLAAGVALNADGKAQAGMGVDAGDYDNDGFLDLVVTTFAQDNNTLYRNLGDGTFEDASMISRLYYYTVNKLGWGAAFFDANLDGNLDLFFANGHIFPQVDDFPALEESFRQKNQLLLNYRSRFWDVSTKAGPGLQVQESSRGLAVGDLDNDGNLDLVISNMDATPTVLQNRFQGSSHWIGFKLTKDGRNRFCIGARVTIDAGGRRQIREVRSGGGYLSQNDLRVHFGLGAYHGPVDVEVQLRGVETWRRKGLPVDRWSALNLTDVIHR